MTEATTQVCAEALLSSWVSRFGVSDDITMDRGPAFLSEIWLALANLMGTTLHNTTALRTALCADGEPSSTEKVYGEAFTVPGEFFPTSTDGTLLDHLRDIAKKFRPCLKTYQDKTKHFMPSNLDDSGYVFVRFDAHLQLLTRPYRGP
ncbi:uncharacterized protein [Palaemon carinicauda]|uniref:uncharacterized protein n=1 Tax=Palaemon carinicauda TaxID=392227 RepID=UPI0035B6823C